jgi:hypothetical protein
MSTGTQKTSKKDVKKAKEWCEKARQILVIKKGTFKRDKETVDSTQFKEALESVSHDLDKLKKENPEKHQLLAKEFVEISKTATVAVEDNNAELAKLLTARLKFFDKQLQEARGKITKKELDEAREQGKQESAALYEKALENASKTLADLEELTDGDHDFTGKVPLHIEVAKEHFKSGTIPHALSRLGLVQAEHDTQLKRHEAYSAFVRERAVAEGKQEELAVLDDPQGEKPSEAVAAVIEEAAELAGEFKYVEATKKLGEVNSTYKSALEKLPKGQQKILKAMAEAKKEFQGKFKSANDALHEVAVLRGAESKPIKDHLDLARVILKKAHDDVAGATDVETIKNATESLKQVPVQLDKAKKASEQAKKSAELDLKAMPEWNKMLREAQNAYELIKSLPGTDVEQDEMFKYIGAAQGKLKSGGQITVGYVAALEAIKGYGEIRKRAEQKSTKAMSVDLPPPVQKAVEQVFSTISLYAAVGPDFLVSARTDDLKRATDNARLALSQAEGQKAQGAAQKEAITKLLELQNSIKSENETLKKEAKAAAEQFVAYEKQLKLVQQAGVPTDLYADLERLGTRARELQMADKEWGLATQNLKTATEGLASIATDHAKHQQTWKTKSAKLEEAVTLGKEMIKWKPLASQANNLLQNAQSVLRTFNETHDYEECLKQYDEYKIESELGELVKASKSSDVPRGDELEGFRKALVAANADVNEAIADARTKKLLPLERKLEGVTDRKATEFHTKLNQVETDWSKYFDSPPSKDLKKLETAKRDAVKAAHRIGGEAEEMLNDKEKFGEFNDNIKKAEEERYKGKRVERIEGLFDKLEGLGHDMTKERRQLAVVLKTTLDKSETEKTLVSFEKDLIKQVDEHWKKIDANRDEAFTTLIDDVAKPLFKVKGRHKNFQPYQEQLESQGLDIRDMLDADDPYLFELGQKRMGELKGRVAEIHPKLRGEDATRYKEVEEKWKHLSNQLGSGTDRVVSKRLPDTYGRLYKQLQEAVEEAQRSSPAEGLVILEKLEKPIAEAVEKAQRLNEEHSKFKKRKEGIDERWTEVKKKTKTWVTEKTEAFATKFESRLNDADAARKAENGLPNAIKILDEVEGWLDQIMDSEDPRAKLQEMDSKFAQEQRLVRDMARQFETDLKVFKEQTLPAAKEAVKEQEDGDKDLVKSLAKVADSAGDIVKPYLNTVASLPHKKAKGEKSPDMQKMLGAFERARTMLSDAQRTAQRLMGQTTTTNVNVSEDLQKVHDNWVEQAKLMSATIRDMAEAIRSELTELENKVDKEGGVSSKELPGVKVAGTKAAKIVADLANHFRQDAFAKPFEVLTKPTPKKKAEKEKLHKEKLAAREEVLRVMRQYRTDILNHPIFRKLTDAKNPFDQPKMMAASAYVRAALKKVELETLIGV